MQDEEILKVPEEPTNIFDPIDFTIFKDEIQDDFQNIVSKTAPDEKEKKTLVLSRFLLEKFSYIFKMDDLKKLDFSSPIYYLENCPQDINGNIVIFLMPSKTECIDLVVKQIERDRQNIIQKQKNFEQNKNSIVEKSYYFYYVPKIDTSINSYIQEKYSFQTAYFKNYFDFELLNFPLDFDLVSLEDSQCFKELYLYKFSDCIDNLANLLIKIQELFGKIKYRYILGENGQILSQLLTRKEKEGFLSDKNSNEILACFFFDRSVDYITPMCTEYTYEAMLHANFDIKFNNIKVKPEIIGIDENKSKIKINIPNNGNSIQDTKEEKRPKDEFKNINLDMSDKLYYMIKNYNFNKIRIFLGKRLKFQQDRLQAGKSNKDFSSIQQDLKFLNDTKNERASLSNHISLADYISTNLNIPRNKRRLQLEQLLLAGDKECLEYIHDYYEMEMARKGDPYELLKLFCLENLVLGGVKTKIYDLFKSDFLMTYDEKLFFLIKNLEELKILRRNESSKIYKTYLDKLNLLNDEVDNFHPNDSSYVFSGYCPISIRFIEKAIKSGWSTINKDILKNMVAFFPEDEKPIINPESEVNYILLTFIGGITYSEIAAIRYLNTSPQFKNYKFLIITTNVISGKNFFDGIKSDDIDQSLFKNDEDQKPKEREEKLPEKQIKKMKEQEEKEIKKKEKIEMDKKKKEEDRKKELEKDREEWRKQKMKEKEKEEKEKEKERKEKEKKEKKEKKDNK